jgi:hypothetical protein
MGKIAPDMVAWKHMARLWHFPRGFATNTRSLSLAAGAAHKPEASKLKSGQRDLKWHVFLALPVFLPPYCDAIRATDDGDFQRNGRRRG